ncbi:hypothetical protein MMAN_28440 [Mycobacterium mantenii]|uniref:DUF302 domain-containing protein n=1 Tax=Mycobacterium mantenii TaxID=560555 RepID=A0A1X0FIQ0_MYCNT|nr:DUF302 domain-containing protein [Mycobacterium mantenii]MCV7245434.1 DUF302 domain-containing protein [Mycobacterium mantenii]ORB01419.1 hypothetical protein BST30_21175 [Mycobacterium mantenii]BBY38710.1 hypothetical protein MMAN_28440 [Mycobacterium mantenii]
MSTSDSHKTHFDGVRVRYDSNKGYDELVAALLADIGERPVPIDEIGTTSNSWDSYHQEVQSHVGPSGFMLFGLFNHGGWITKAGIDRKVLRVIFGNPLIAITMLRHDVTAGLFAPVEVLITDEGAGSSLTYVKPSSLMVMQKDSAPNPELLSAAQGLDAKLAALVEKVTGGC